MLRWLRPLLSPQAARAVLSGQPALCAGLFGDHDRPLCARRWGGRQVSAHSSVSAREFGIRQACRHRGRQGLHLAGAITPITPSSPPSHPSHSPYPSHPSPALTPLTPIRPPSPSFHPMSTAAPTKLYIRAPIVSRGREAKERA